MVGYYKRLIILFFFFLSIIYCLQFNMFKQSCRRGNVQARNSPSCNQKGKYTSVFITVMLDIYKTRAGSTLDSCPAICVKFKKKGNVYLAKLLTKS